MANKEFLKPLKRAMKDHIYLVLEKCCWNRTYTATILQLSIRSLRTYITEMKEEGYDIKDYCKQEADESEDLLVIRRKRKEAQERLEAEYRREHGSL